MLAFAPRPAFLHIFFGRLQRNQDAVNAEQRYFPGVSGLCGAPVTIFDGDAAHGHHHLCSRGESLLGPQRRRWTCLRHGHRNWIGDQHNTQPCEGKGGRLSPRMCPWRTTSDEAAAEDAAHGVRGSWPRASLAGESAAEGVFAADKAAVEAGATVKVAFATNKAVAKAASATDEAVARLGLRLYEAAGGGRLRVGGGRGRPWPLHPPFLPPHNLFATSFRNSSTTSPPQPSPQPQQAPPRPPS